MDIEKKIYFLTDLYSYKSAVEDAINVSTTYRDTLTRIGMNERLIFTTQMGLLDYNLFMKGYRIYIVSESDHYEIPMLGFDRIGGKGFTARDDLFEMWKSGLLNK